MRVTLPKDYDLTMTKVVLVEDLKREFQHEAHISHSSGIFPVQWLQHTVWKRIHRNTSSLAHKFDTRWSTMAVLCPCALGILLV